MNYADPEKLQTTSGQTRRSDFECDKSEILRLEEARAVTRTALGASVKNLDSVINASADNLVDSAILSSIGLVFLRVLSAYGIDVRTTVTTKGRLARAEHIEEVAQALGVRTRRIILTADWWLEDHSHLIARLASSKKSKSEGDDNERIVALISEPNGGYAYYNPRTGDQTTITASNASDIEPVAYAPYPPLPQKASGFLDLAGFLLPLIRNDLMPVIAASAVIGLLGMAFPIATAVIIDSLIPSGERGLLIQIGIALLVGAFLTSIFSVVRQTALLRINGKTSLIMQAAVWDRLLKLPVSFFSGYSSGDLEQRVSGVADLRSAIISIVLSTTITAAFSLFYLGLLFYYDTRLALLGVGIVLLLAVTTFITGVSQIKYHKQRIEISGWLSGYLFQALQGIIKLRIAAAEHRAFVRWAEKYTDERAAILKVRRIGNHFSAFAEIYGTLSLAMIFAASQYLTEQRLTAGMFIAFIAAFGNLQSAFQGLSGATLQFVSVLPDWERAKPILETAPETSAKAVDPGRLTGSIEITNLTFAYKNGGNVLSEVSVTIKAGEQVALIGPSGSGKSTLVRNLLGLESPQTGSILYDSQDLTSLDLTLVRRQIGVVTQTGRLYAGSIMDNIRGARSATFEDCMEACLAAGFEHDLTQLPMGLHTPLTEGAPTLSGGQRQRVLIARALVARPRILIFDEATSALDNQTQAIVTESLNRLDVTQLVVAHRLSTIQRADRIYVLDKGYVVEHGTYDSLLEQNGLFASLAKRQLT